MSKWKWTCRHCSRVNETDVKELRKHSLRVYKNRDDKPEVEEFKVWCNFCGHQQMIVVG